MSKSVVIESKKINEIHIMGGKRGAENEGDEDGGGFVEALLAATSTISTVVSTVLSTTDQFMHTPEFKRHVVEFFPGDTLMNLRLATKTWKAAVDALIDKGVKNTTILVHQGRDIRYEAFKARKERCKLVTRVMFHLNRRITRVGMWAFRFADNLVSVEIPEGVESIGERAFYRCSNLTTVSFPSTLKSIGDSAFMQCSNIIDNVDLLHTNLVALGRGAFAGCSELKVVRIPDSIQYFGVDVFLHCVKLCPSSIDANHQYNDMTSEVVVYLRSQQQQQQQESWSQSRERPIALLCRRPSIVTLFLFLLSLLIPQTSSILLSSVSSTFTFEPAVSSLIEQYYTLLLPNKPITTFSSPLPPPPQRLLLSSPQRFKPVSTRLRYELYDGKKLNLGESEKMVDCVRRAVMEEGSKKCPLTTAIINPPSNDIPWILSAHARYLNLKNRGSRRIPLGTRSTPSRSKNSKLANDSIYASQFLKILNQQTIPTLKPNIASLPAGLVRWYYRTKPDLNLLNSRDYAWCLSQYSVLKNFPKVTPEELKKAGGKNALKRLGLIESDYGCIERDKVLRCFEVVIERIESGKVGDETVWMRMPEGIFGEEEWEEKGRRLGLELDYFDEDPLESWNRGELGE
ncbi:hypothetical protein TL16_g03152 [Triparma laevis f. inornata]|uniref:Uncharacterized protein n=1 Tax=Triparma laevis f. inornata TaxID=1714386 RepID=A0A9W7A0Z3_9STRA|nr:hypothetical protein TL16_g03152 [Triparma laevis f. inornata]